MHRFLSQNREELIARCKRKVAQRPHRAATASQLENGIPVFLEQLRRTLEAEELGLSQESLRISGASGGDNQSSSEMGTSAAAHGRQLLELGFTVVEVVHDYGDLCQSITDLAVERHAPISVQEFRTLNRCLDNAIADAVNEFCVQSDGLNKRQQLSQSNQELGSLVHELRNATQTAVLAMHAIEAGTLTVAGATGSVLKRSLENLSRMLDTALDASRADGQTRHAQPVFSVADFIADAHGAAALNAADAGCTLSVERVQRSWGIAGDRQQLAAALQNLLQNAFKFTAPGTEVGLHAFVSGPRVLIEVRDHCGGLAPGSTEKLFTPFHQRSDDRTGAGLGLSIARQNVQADGGLLTVRNMSGIGCVFTISLPLQSLE